jgi:5-methylcytosine-specific restriction protein A
MRDTLLRSIVEYKQALQGKWANWESYKFEFANYINKNINWSTQTDDDILNILIKSQKIKYTDSHVGIQFIKKSGRKKLSEFITLKDVELLRSIQNREPSEIEWTERGMSFTGLSAWIASLFPYKLYPIPVTEFDITIQYLFDVEETKFPKKRDKYIFACQKYMKMTRELLENYQIGSEYLNIWNEFYKTHPELNIQIKSEFSETDWVWLAQDFHLFVHREVLKLCKLKERAKKKNLTIQEELEFEAIEGQRILAKHLRIERNSTLIKKIKKAALVANPYLNCKVCGFSFYKKYGEVGLGFIEAHHLIQLSDCEVEKVTSQKNIILVCSNCHRMLHKTDNMSVEKLKKLIDSNKAE